MGAIDVSCRSTCTTKSHRQAWLAWLAGDTAATASVAASTRAPVDPAQLVDSRSLTAVDRDGGRAGSRPTHSLAPPRPGAALSCDQLFEVAPPPDEVYD
jgi:hypothetical protein